MDEGDVSSTTVKLCLPWTWRPFKRHMLPGCQLFVDGDRLLHSSRKLLPLEDDSEADDRDANTMRETIPCGVVGCPQTFTSLLSYENHYNSAHRHSCHTCHRLLPSAHLLDIHIQENHDPLFSILACRQSMYQCLVESCSEKFSSPGDRRQHLIKTHHYPANFRFHRLRCAGNQQRKKGQTDRTGDTMEVDHSSSVDSHRAASEADTRSSSGPLLPETGDTPSAADSHKERSASTGSAQRSDGKAEDESPGMDVLEAELERPSAPRRVFVHKVPHSLSFGHGVSRGFLRPARAIRHKGGHWHQRQAHAARETTTNIENVDMRDMADALSDAL